MSDSDRFQKEDPERAHPWRNVAEGLRSEDPWRVRPGPGRPGQYRKRGPVGEESASDGVDDAYRVADEHMREGQWRAGSRNQRGYAWRSQGSPGYQGYGSPFGYGYGGRSADGFLEQVMRVYLDMMGLVGSMMNGLVRPPYPRPFESRRDPDFPYAPDAPPRPRPPAVRVEVTSNQANHIALDLKPIRPRVSLAVPPLRALNNNRSELRDVELDAANDRCTLRVHIPDAQPPGLYTGVVVDARTGEPCGTLAIRVGSPAEQTEAPPPKPPG